ncbi:MAG: maleylpyruvate isomerase [Actinomycetia bacterium]|nr:maleylpyruvate isomerase [Actinomycetes bacterium]
MKPVADLAACASAHRALLVEVDAFDDTDMRRPSLLPGWTIAHVCTHLARNADSHVHRFAAAGRGEMVDQYAGGLAGRAAEIEAGTARDAATIIADVRGTIAAFAAAADAVPDDAWECASRDARGAIRPAWELPLRRWQEVEVHRVDFGRGYSHREWTDAFLDRLIPLVREKLPERLAPGTPIPSLVDINERDVLAWWYDRLEIDGLPALQPYG